MSTLDKLKEKAKNFDVDKALEDMKDMKERSDEAAKNVLENDELFIPCTKETHITTDIVWRPIRSWHQCTFAGEGLEKYHGDGSGCLKAKKEEDSKFLRTCMQPKTAIHRIYWHKGNPEFHVSAFLSYPGGMSSVEEYHWELYPFTYVNEGDENYTDNKRFFGPDAEQEMEECAKEILLKQLKDAVIKKIRGEQKNN